MMIITRMIIQMTVMLTSQHPTLLPFSLSHLHRPRRQWEACGQSLRFVASAGRVSGERSACRAGEVCLDGVTGKEARRADSCKCQCYTLFGLFFFWLSRLACRVLVPSQGWDLGHPAVEMWSFNLLGRCRTPPCYTLLLEDPS